MVIYWKENNRDDFYDWVDYGLGYGGSADSEDIEIITDKHDVGNRMFKCVVINPSVDRRAELARWEETKDLTEIYFGCSFELSPNLDPVDWLVIMQLKGLAQPALEERKFLLAIKPSTHQFEFIQDFRGAYFPEDPGPIFKKIWVSKNPAPKGERFHIAIYLRLTQDGNVKVWYNGNLVAQMNGDFRQVPHVDSRGTWKGVHLRCGLYESSQNTQSQYVIVDKAIIASTLEEVGVSKPSQDTLLKLGFLIFGAYALLKEMKD